VAISKVPISVQNSWTPAGKLRICLTGADLL
jgi:hypothetical protein